MEALLIIIAVVGLIIALVYFFKEEPSGTKDKTAVQTNIPIIQTDAALQQQAFAEKRGEEGEERIRRVLAGLPRQEYIVLSDVLLPTASGTTQLDHIVVSVYGIFVIEAKNYQGQIYGRIDGEEWIKYVNGKEYRFQNPLHQNCTHVKAVARLTGISPCNIFPLTVFTGSAVLKIQGCDQVIYEYSLLPTIRMHNTAVFTREQAEQYARIIDEAIIESSETKSAHLQYVKEVVFQKNREISMGQCPRCSGTLVRRKGKYGDFYGCSNYPDCKYTRNI